MKEFWKNIEGFEGRYLVSNKGQIKSVKSNIVLKGVDNGSGYKQVSLSNNGASKKIYIHRVVAKYFLENPKNKPCVNHKDFNKSNNCVHNLEWCTYKENKEHAKIHQRISKGETQHLSKLTKKDVVKILNNKETMSCQDQADMYNVHVCTIRRVINRETWKHVEV